MSFPEPFSPRGRTAASGPDPMPGGFTGQARDLPAPFEFPPLAAVQLLAAPPALVPELTRGTETVPALPPTEPPLDAPPPMVPVETAFRLQELATALARPPRPTAPVPAAAAPAAFSLTALADQLQSRFTQPNPAEDGGLDLLAGAAAAPALESAAVTSPAPANPLGPGKSELATGLAALLPSLGVKPAAAAVSLTLAAPPPAAPVVHEKTAYPSRPSPLRQGDVFFMEAPASLLASEPLSVPDALDLVEAPPDSDLMDPVDLMEAPPLPQPKAAAPLPLPPREVRPDLPPPLPTVAPVPDAPNPPAESGLGLTLGGTGLILLGIYAACQLPLLWLNLEDGTSWDRQKTLSALVLHGAAALTLLTFGTGSLMLRRWAPPLIHAAGWIAALTASGIIAVAGFHLVNAEADAALPDSTALFGLLAALLVPLACIFYYQQESTTTACETASPAPAWTDGMPVPALMVFLTGLALAAGAGAMLCHLPAFPLVLEPPLTGPTATAAWGTLGMLGLGIAVSVRLKRAAALWLLLLAALVLAVSLSPAAITGGAPWQQFLTALGASPGATAPPLPLLTALIPAPLLLVFAMARRSFSSPPPP